MIRLTFIIALFFTTLQSFAQKDIDTAMVRTYGGERFEEANDIIQTDDGGYFILGSSGSLDDVNSDIYLIKVSRDLEFEWSRLYGGQNIDRGQSIVSDGEGNYLIQGYTLNSAEGKGYDILVKKIDAAGEEIWSETFGGNDWDFGYEIISDSLGGFLVIGETWSYGSGESDAYLIKINNEGNLLWENSYGTNHLESGTDICLAIDDDGFLITGFTDDQSLAQGFVMKVDEFGETVWDAYNNESSNNVINGIVQMESGYMCIGYFQDSEGLSHMSFQELSGDGLLDPVSYYNSQGNQVLSDLALVEQEQMFLYLGTSDAFGNGGLGMYTLRRSVESSSVLANRVWGGSEDEEGNGVYVDDESAVLIYGSSESYGLGSVDMYLVKIQDPNLVAEYIIQVEHYEDSFTSSTFEEHNRVGIKLYPNPAVTKVSLSGTMESDCEVAIFNQLGRLVERQKFSSNEINIEHLSSGAYLIHVLDDNGNTIAVSKLIKE